MSGYVVVRWGVNGPFLKSFVVHHDRNDAQAQVTAPEVERVTPWLGSDEATLQHVEALDLQPQGVG